MRVLVTGASGFIGRNVLLGLPREDEIVATYRRDEAFPAFLRARGLSNVTALRVDLCDAGALRAASQKPFDACVYLAANGDPAYSDKVPVEDLRLNTLALLNTLAEWRFGHFVYFSSGAVYDGSQGMVNPSTPIAPVLPYAISKYASERYVLHARKQGRVGVASNVRFFGAYGPYEPERKIYGRLVRQFAIDRDPRFTLRGDGRNLIDAMYVDDTVRAIRLILAKADASRTFDLCSGTPLTLAALVREAARTFGVEPHLEFTGDVPEYIEFRSNDATMARDFGFTPSVPLSEGLRRFHGWMQEEARAEKVKA